MVNSNSKSLKPRPPIVVVMGHVDHGKTTLLDYIRKTNVAGREAGGITQAIGAYEIIHNGRKITFIDTPGHEAFSKMRSRGATVADLAVLVVAADESVKPQTKEAVETLNQAKTPFIVAVSKTDKPGADIEKVKNDLTAAGVLLEGYGGQISWHGISAKTGEGVNELLDLILLATDVENLTYDPQAPASGYVLETRHDRRRGDEVTVILKNGTLKRGDVLKTPSAQGKVKILEDFLGKVAEKLEPSAPAVIVGLERLPAAGDEFLVGELEVREKVKGDGRRLGAVGKSGQPALNLILKASDAGSLEALSVVIRSLEKEDKTLNIIDELVGDVTDGDVKSAIATGSSIIGFKSRVDKAARNLAESHEVKIIISEVIYDLVKAAEEFLNNIGKPVTLGELEILVIFNQKKQSEQLVGGKITSGIVRNKTQFEIKRRSDEGEKTMGTGRVVSLREKKDEITEAAAGKEIGILANASALITVGDKLVIKK